MPLPHWLAKVNRRFTNRVLGSLPRRISPFVILHHRGRSSGRAYSTPLASFSTETGIILPPTYGPEADWVRNVLAASSFDVDRRGVRTTYGSPRLVGRDDVRPYLPVYVRAVMWLLRIDWYVSAEEL